MMDVFGGTAGWSYEDWVGPFYPAEAPKGFSRLEFYSGFFDCVEVDSTFYRHFPPNVAEKWLREVEKNGRFVFLLKLYKGFTHDRSETGINLEGEISVVRNFFRPFAERGKLGGVLAQFSEYFRDTAASRSRIASIKDAFHEFQLFFELRHSSWYTEAAVKFLAAHDIGVIAIDQPLLPDMVPLIPDIVGGVGYFRLHGRNEKMWGLSRRTLAESRSPGPGEKDDPGRNERYNYLYSSAELDEIERKIRGVGERCERIYVVLNNHPMGKAVANALELVRRLRGQEKINVPDTVTKFFPELERFAATVKTGPSDTLF